MAVHATIVGFNFPVSNDCAIREKAFLFFALVSSQSTVLSSATQHIIPPEIDGKWGVEFFFFLWKRQGKRAFGSPDGK